MKSAVGSPSLPDPCSQEMWFSFIYSYCFQSIRNRRDVTGQSICTILSGKSCQKRFMVVSTPPVAPKCSSTFRSAPFLALCSTL